MPKLNLSDKTGFLILGNVFSKIFSFLIVVFMVRLVDKSEYGSFQQVWLILGIFYSIFAGSIPLSLYFFLPGAREEEQKAFLYQSIIILLCMGIISGFAMYFLGHFISVKFNNPYLEQLLTIACIFAIFWIGQAYFINLLIVKEKFKLSIIIGVLETLSNMLSIIIPLWMGFRVNTSLWTLSVVGGIRYAAYAIYSLFYFKKITLEWRKSLLVDQVKYCFPMQVSGWIDAFGGEIGKIIISLLYPPAIFAIYSVGAVKIPLWQIITNPANAVLRVKFSELHKEQKYFEMVQICNSAIRKQALIVFPITFFLFTIAPEFISVFFTTQYQESVIVFQILTIALLLHSISSSVIPMSTGKTVVILYGSMLFLAINGAFSFLFAKLFGYYGPAIATTLTLYSVTGFYLYKVKEITNVGFENLLPWGELLKIGVACLMASVMTYGVTLIHVKDIYSIAIAFICFFGVYIFLSIKTGLINKDDRALISRWLKLHPIMASYK